MKLKVQRINQMSSGGSYVVIYDADIELLSQPGTVVEILSTEPPDSDPELVELARLAILRGAECVLGPLGLGATINVLRLVIHPGDFKPHRFEAFTATELEQLVASHFLTSKTQGGA